MVFAPALASRIVGAYRDGEQYEANGPDGVASTAMDIIIPSHLMRCGKQVKLVLGADDTKAPEPHPKLVEMVLQARRWFAELSSGAKPSMAEIALNAGVDRTYVSRLITLAFLAPDLVERIITGNHAATLTPERLRKACPCPRIGMNRERCCWVELPRPIRPSTAKASPSRTPSMRRRRRSPSPERTPCHLHQQSVHHDA